MRRMMVLCTAALALACTPQPAELAPRPAPFEVSAPFEKTWNAVIDVFAERNIPIATIDKSSGLIVASPDGRGDGAGVTVGELRGRRDP